MVHFHSRYQRMLCNYFAAPPVWWICSKAAEWIGRCVWGGTTYVCRRNEPDRRVHGRWDCIRRDSRQMPFSRWNIFSHQKTGTDKKNLLLGRPTTMRRAAKFDGPSNNAPMLLTMTARRNKFISQDMNRSISPATCHFHFISISRFVCFSRPGASIFLSVRRSAVLSRFIRFTFVKSE